MRSRSVVLALLLLHAAPAVVSAQSYAIQGLEHYFRLEWEAASGRHSPVIAGYVYNLSGHTADRVRLAVDTLDGAGQATASVVGQVVGTVPPHGRASFEVPVRHAGTYRVRVLSFDPVGRGQ